jgi:DNA-binding transcriptional MerR regulator
VSNLAFDTLKYVRQLQDSGVPMRQAEAFVQAQREILQDVLDVAVATKEDLRPIYKHLDSIEAKIDQLDVSLNGKIDINEARMKGDVTLLQWMLGLIGTGIVAIVLKTYFPGL